MKVMLINIDSKIPNLALKKIEKYHLDRGDEVIWDNELFKNQVDKIYVSCIFDYNKDKCKEWESRAEIGGSGYSLSKVLPKEIEDIQPRINLGFTTRGCIRNCHFCIVPKKEGRIRAIGDIYDIWDGKSKELIIIDNNIFALPEHFKLICSQIKKEGLTVDFNQGLDIRLLTEDIAITLKTIKLKRYRFAFDNLNYRDSVIKGLKILEKVGIRGSNCFWYVYADEDIESTIERLLILKRANQRCFLMCDRRVYHWPKYQFLSRWVIGVATFRKMDILDYFNYYKNKNYLKEQKSAKQQLNFDLI